jgi:type VI secretion system protein ImpE
VTTQELLSAGELQEAIRSLSAELRDHPSDLKRRTFLFELLCFAGDYSRAEKHLSVLADRSPESNTGAILYRSALRAERARQLFFESGQYRSSDAALNAASAEPCSGTLNGTPFESIEDIDPRVGPRLEVFLAGEYMWMPFAGIGELTIDPPRKLRDTLWANGSIIASESLNSNDFGVVLLPVLYPFSWKHPDQKVRLGRETVSGADSAEGEVPFGQKLLLVDGENIVPFLEVRSLVFNKLEPAESEESAAV